MSGCFYCGLKGPCTAANCPVAKESEQHPSHCLCNDCMDARTQKLPEGPALNVRREEPIQKCEDCDFIRQSACKTDYAKRFLASADQEFVQVPPCMTFGEAARAVEEYRGSLIERVKAGLAPKATITTDSKERKDTPIYSGVLAYFPLALAAVAQLSKAGNDKHNPGEPLHWSKDKSNDHADCIARHLLELGTVDPDDGFLHDVKLAWRALANLQIRLEGGK